MTKKQKNYTNELKQQMVALYKKSSEITVALSDEYGLPKSTLHKWIRVFSPIKGSDKNISLKDYKTLQKQTQELKSAVILFLIIKLHRRSKIML